MALPLLPLPFFIEFRRHHDAASLALGVYVALITLAPCWGTFPVPVMGYGVSPIVGYFLALALSKRALAGDNHGSTTAPVVRSGLMLSRKF